MKSFIDKNIKNFSFILFSSVLTLWYLTITGKFFIDSNVFFLSLTIISGIYYYIEKKYYTYTSQKNKPWWFSWTSDIFIFILILFLFRAFLYEPFRVPTGSMLPTIQLNDIIIINKFKYDIKIPIDYNLKHNNDVKRGDIIVFKYPLNKSVYYVKRTVGLPGDIIEYDFNKKQLTINNKNIEKKQINSNSKLSQYHQNLGVHTFTIQELYKLNIIPKNISKNCELNNNKLICLIPAKSYFMMGDNRDNSYDSRFWGFVPEQNIIGKAEYIFFSLYKEQYGKLN